MATILFGIEAALKAMLRDISEHYEIPYEDLEERYLVPKDGDENSTLPDSDQEVESKPKKVTKKKKASEDEEERPKCSAKTAKGAPCKNLSLAGKCYCRVHQNKFGEEDSEDEGKPKKVASKPKKVTKKKSKKVVDPDDLIESEEESTPVQKKGKGKVPDAPKKAHTHKADEEGEDCDECNRKGDPVKKLEDEFEEDEDTSRKLEDILDKLDMMGAESDEEGDGNEEEDLFGDDE
jgi:hypothetical protein